MNADIREMEIADYNILQNIVATFTRLWKLKFVVLLATLIGIFVSVLCQMFIKDDFVYYSSSTIYSAVYGSYSETVSGVTIMNAYSGILRSSRVCDRAEAEINNPLISSEYLQALVTNGQITLSGASTSSKSYGYRLTLTVRMNTPEYVIDITNAVSNAFVSELNELFGKDIVQVFDQPKACFASSSTTKRIIVIAIPIAFFVLAVFIICIIEFLSTKVYIVSQCEMDKNLVLGVVPYIKKD